MFILLVVLFFVALGVLLAGIGIYTALKGKKSRQYPPRPPKFFGVDGKPRTLTPKELKQRKTAHVTRRTAENSSHIHRSDDSISTASAISYSTFSTENETNWSVENSHSSSSGDWSSSSDTSWNSSSDSGSSSSDSGSSSSSDFGGGGSGGDW